MKTLSRRHLLIVIFSGCVIFVIIFFYFLSKTSTRDRARLMENADAHSKQEQTSVGLPVRLKILEINVDSVVEYVGLTSDGAMDVPKDQGDVAWFKFGQRPGEIGSAVIVGHYGTWKNGKGSVFDNLYKLRKGDKIYVEDDKGIVATFVVRESRRYDPKADASDVFGSNDGKAHLNLITCGGIWNKVSKSYSQRIIVFADKETKLGL